MVILGINYYFHDTTACVVIDGELRAAIEEERLTRQKHTGEFPERAIARCLEICDLTPDQIDHVAVSIRPGKHQGAKIVHALKNLGGIKPFLRHELLGRIYNQRALYRWFNATFPGRKPPLHFVEHHLAHVVGSFCISPYQEAALLSMDGAGEWATSWLGRGEGTRVERFAETFFPNSMGSFYEAATEFCGFKSNYDEGKTMGLAPFGDPDRFYDQVKSLVTVRPDGRIVLDQSSFNFKTWDHRRCSDRFYQAFGQPRQPGAPFEKHHEDVAAAFQRVLEETALQLCDILHRRTRAEHLVIAGGVSLNSVMNGRIIRDSPFRDVYVMPAAGDNGTAIGAAYYVLHEVLGAPRTYVHDNPYLGTEYSNEEIEKILVECKLPHEHHEDICGETARRLQAGEIIGWFQGRMEIGPRALGNRSILADPSIPGMKDKINAEVKHREPYRPFAPSGIAEAKERFFDITVDAPFMLKVCNVLPEAQDQVRAITHVDGTARLQTVHRETNPRYHELISKFGELTGVPVVLNTSFNIMGEPIVENPLHAIRCFFSTGLDTLVMGNFLVTK